MNGDRKLYKTDISAFDEFAPEFVFEHQERYHHLIKHPDDWLQPPDETWIEPIFKKYGINASILNWGKKVAT